MFFYIYSLNGFLDFLSAIRYLTAEKINIPIQNGTKNDSVLHCGMKKKEHFKPCTRIVECNLYFIRFPAVHGLKFKIK